MFEIRSLNNQISFNREQVNNLLPLVYRITEEYSKEVKYLMACVEAIPNKESSRCLELQDQINDLIQKWQNKIERLGGKPKGLWLIDFDHGSGYFCWKFPETQILFSHGYQDGFTGRKLIENNTVEKTSIESQDKSHENSNSSN